MATLQVPTEGSINLAFVQETELDGTTYRLTFRWNAREGAWYLSVHDLEDQPLIPGRKLVCGAFLGRHARVEGQPPGQLLVINTASPGRDPGRDDFANGAAALIYEEVGSLPTPVGLKPGGS
jgi:hypothetical protein